MWSSASSEFSGNGVTTTFLPLVEIPARRRRAAVLGAGDRVRRHELAYPLAERFARRGNDVTLGRTAIGDDGIRPEIGGDALEDLRHLRHRRGDENDVGILDFVRRVDAGAVDHAQFLRHAQGGWRAPEADHLLDRLGLLERKREGTADQAGAEDNDFSEFGHSESPRGKVTMTTRRPENDHFAIPRKTARQRSISSM